MATTLFGIDVTGWLEIITAIAATILISQLASLILANLLKKRSFPVETGKRIVAITKYGILTIGAILIILFLAFQLVVAALVSLSFLGLAIGFGLASVISNFTAGVSVMINKSVVVGDEIKVGFFEGKITKITMTKTVLETNDGEIVYVPNSYFMSNPISRKKHTGPTDHKHDIDEEGVV